MEIRYSAVVKNPRRKSAKWYGRIRQDGRERFIPLKTQDRAEAMKWVERQKNILFQVNEYEERGLAVPDDLQAKLLTVDSNIVPAQKAEVPFTAPGGVLDAWEVDARVRGMRPSTIKTYTRAFTFLLHGESPGGLTVQKVHQRLAEHAHVTGNTMKHYCNALRSLFRFMGRVDLVNSLPHPKGMEAEHVFWGELEMFEVIASVELDDAAKTEQYREYFEVLAAIGSRNTETALLKWRNLNEDISVTFPAEITKAGKTRTVPLPMELYGRLDMRRGEPDERVFPLVALSQPARYRVLQKAIAKAGVPGAGLHMFRRSRSVLLYKKVRDIKVCASLLGDSEAVALKHYQDAVTLDEIRSAAFDE